MQSTKPENPFFNIAFNILIPVVILNKGHLWFSHRAELWSLLLALAFPILYGLFDLLKNNRKNIVSLLGVLNVLFTGGFALLSLSGMWFAVKEATFPLLIGVFVLFSAYAKKNFFEVLIRQIPLRWDLIDEKTKDHPQALKKLFKKATIWFSFSFFISAILNFVLALLIFIKQPDSVSINKKIADMTWMGYLVIGVPLTLFSGFVLWQFFKGLSQLTDLSLEQITPHKSNDTTATSTQKGV